MKNKIIKLSPGKCNSYLIQAEKGFIMVDAGISAKIDKVFGILKDKINHVSDIKLIIITHVHHDHVGSLKQLKERTGAQVLVHKSEVELLQKGVTKFPKGTNKFSTIISTLVNKIFSSMGKFEPVKPDITITKEYDLSSFGIDGKIIHTPGHTVGSISVILREGECLVGDTMFNISPWTVFPIFANDTDKLKQSWKKINQYRCKSFYPGHGKQFGNDKFAKSWQKYEI